MSIHNNNLGRRKLSQAIGPASLPERLGMEYSVSDEGKVSRLMFIVQFTVRQMRQVDEFIFCENLWLKQFLVQLLEFSSHNYHELF